MLSTRICSFKFSISCCCLSRYVAIFRHSVLVSDVPFLSFDFANATRLKKFILSFSLMFISVLSSGTAPSFQIIKMSYNAIARRKMRLFFKIIRSYLWICKKT